MPNRILFAVLAVLAATLLPAAANAAPNRPASPPPTDFWKDQGFMLFAHQGGERENPGNTLYAFKKAIADGADVIDMDVTLTEDGVLVATHDSEPCHTSNAPCTDSTGPVTFRNQTLAELRQYDFAYWFSPGLATYYDKGLDVPHPYRGMAFGNPAPPSGYNEEDFRIATFDEVLTDFPHTPINVELKPYADAQATASAAAAVLAEHPGREKDVIVNSFSQDMIEKFKAAAPNHLAVGGSLEGTLAYIQGTPITPTPVAIQPPDKYNLSGNIVDTLPILKQFFEYDGYISVVWPSDLDETQETNPWYAKLISQGADAINTMFPSRLQAYLCDNGIPRPNGKPRCAKQECPEGQTGLAPDNCQKLVDFRKLSVKPLKNKVRLGKQAKFRVQLSNRGVEVGTVSVTVRSSNRKVTKPRTFSMSIKPGATAGRTIAVVIPRSIRKQAKLTITVAAGSSQSQTTFALKPPKRKKTWWDSYTPKGEVKIVASQNTQQL